MSAWHILLVAGGGCIGAVARHLVVVSTHHHAPGFPLGTLLVNTLGSLLIGLLAIVLPALVATDSAAYALRLLLVTGMLGAFTTFSAFSLDTLLLIEHGHWGRAVVNVLVNVTLCLALAALGMWIGRSITAAAAG